jgi:hypothetical protein
MKKYKVYTITEKATNAILYIGETGQPLNLRFNCHVAKCDYPGSGKFGGRRDEIKMEVVASFDTKKEAYKHQCELQTLNGFKSDYEKLKESVTDSNGKLWVHYPEAIAKKNRTMIDTYGIPVLVYEKRTGRFVGEYETIRSACDAFNADVRNVSNCLKGVRYKSVNGYIFKKK